LTKIAFSWYNSESTLRDVVAGCGIDLLVLVQNSKFFLNSKIGNFSNFKKSVNLKFYFFKKSGKYDKKLE
jgi:hypothetical protein